MSVFRSYITKNNTIISNSNVNTGRNPVAELNFGTSFEYYPDYSFTRYIFDIDLNDLRNNINSGLISTGCTSAMTHTLKMVNTSTFDVELLNTEMSNGKMRAISFDLILFRIPKTSGDTGDPQIWDEGVGYDYDNFNLTKNSARGGLTPYTYVDFRAFSERPSNWYKTTTIDTWSEPGIYDNKNEGSVNYSGLTIVDTQHFELGNENLEMDMTNEINGILHGTITGVTGWGLAFVPDVENISGLTENYSVAFFSRHTQTFYQPYLETNYDDLIQDDRNLFLKNQTNKLYLYVYQNGDPINLDTPPNVKIEDRKGVMVNCGILTSCLKTKGIYEVEVPNCFTGYSTPCNFYDVWTGLTINGQSVPNVTNQFTLQQLSAGIQIGYNSKEPTQFGFNIYGILQNEKILNTDIRKVGVTIKKAYTAQQMYNNVVAYYRIYVREGMTEVEVQDWTELNRTPNEYYFIFDTRDKIPNQYYVDVQVHNGGDIDTYKRQLTFEIVNRK